MAAANTTAQRVVLMVSNGVRENRIGGGTEIAPRSRRGNECAPILSHPPTGGDRPFPPSDAPGPADGHQPAERRSTPPPAESRSYARGRASRRGRGTPPTAAATGDRAYARCHAPRPERSGDDDEVAVWRLFILDGLQERPDAVQHVSPSIGVGGGPRTARGPPDCPRAPAG